jgi:single-strand DNA-binding protein
MIPIKIKRVKKMTTTEWHNIVLWSPLAEIAEKYLTKGKQVYIEGRLVNRSYTDKEGQTKYITEIVAQHMLLLGGNGREAGEAKERECCHASMDDLADDPSF